MRLIRITFAVVVIAFAAALIRTVVWQPYRCGRSEKTLEALIAGAFESADAYQANSIARQVVDSAEACLRHTPDDVALYMIAGAGYRIVERPVDAVRMYRTALRYDRRPELYLNLGLADIQAGNTNDAFVSLLTAAVFRPELLEDMPSPMRQRVEAALKRYWNGETSLVPLFAGGES
jgi:hypothetical protein